MLVPLLVWGAVWFYLWNLDGRVKRLEEQERLDDQAHLGDTNVPGRHREGRD